jgi:carboxymethylenebutenolidase
VTTKRSEAVSIDGDGDGMTMTVWVPDAGHGPGILLIQEIFGVGPYIAAVAERLADAGYVVGAPDVFWRFAPNWVTEHDEEGLAASMGQVGNLNFDQAIQDCVVAIDHLAGLPEVYASQRPGVLGFCLGGTLGFAVAIADSPSVCVSYYGSGVPSMIGAIDEVKCPTLFHFGRADAYIPFEGVEAVADAIGDRRHVVLNVEEAGHAFDNHEAEMFHDEAAARAAWSKTMAYLTEHLPVSP